MHECKTLFQWDLTPENQDVGKRLVLGCDSNVCEYGSFHREERRRVLTSLVLCCRALVMFLVFIVTFAFWLFYGVRIYEKAEPNYHSIGAY